jgi:AbrB family looped-hinge helix DNA binding protein
MGKAMDVSATVTSKGQVTIPAAMRERLGLKAGDRIRFVEGPDGRVTVERRETLSFADLRGIVKLDHPVTAEEIDRWCREARDGGWSRERE